MEQAPLCPVGEPAGGLDRWGLDRCGLDPLSLYFF
jgi:hypothetical protein